MIQATATTRLAVAGLMLACALAAGCVTQPKDDPRPRRRGPRLGQLASRIEIPREERPYGPVRLFAFAVRLELPLDQTTDRAWELVDETTSPSVLSGAWKTNGLRVGMLDESKLAEFEKALPPIGRVNRASIINRFGRLYPIYLSPPVARPVRVDLTVPPHVTNMVTLRAGRCQMLARLMHEEGMPDVLELIPHHHVAKHSIVPRPLHEEALDGRIFEELALTVPLQETGMVVIGLNRPFPKIEDEGDGDGGRDAGTEARRDEGGDAAGETTTSPPPVPAEPGDAAGEDQGADSPTPDPGPETPDAPPPARFGPPPPFGPHLGRQFFAGRRDAKDVQILLMLRIDMLESNLPQVDTAKRK